MFMKKIEDEQLDDKQEEIKKDEQEL